MHWETFVYAITWMAVTFLIVTAFNCVLLCLNVASGGTFKQQWKILKKNSDFIAGITGTLCIYCFVCKLITDYITGIH